MKYVAKDNDEVIVDVVQAKKDTTIDTVDGDALVTKGNYIATILSEWRKGKQFGITEADLNRQYVKSK